MPPVAVVFIAGMFWRSASATGAIATLVGGHLVSALLFLLSLIDVLTLHFTLIAGLLALVSVVITLSCSRLGSAPKERQLAGFTFHRETVSADPALAWWQDYRLHALVLGLPASALVYVHALPPGG